MPADDNKSMKIENTLEKKGEKQHQRVRLF